MIPSISSRINFLLNSLLERAWEAFILFRKCLVPGEHGLGDLMVVQIILSGHLNSYMAEQALSPPAIRFQGRDKHVGKCRFIIPTDATSDLVIGFILQNWRDAYGTRAGSNSELTRGRVREVA